MHSLFGPAPNAALTSAQRKPAQSKLHFGQVFRCMSIWSCRKILQAASSNSSGSRVRGTGVHMQNLNVGVCTGEDACSLENLQAKKLQLQLIECDVVHLTTSQKAQVQDGTSSAAMDFATAPVPAASLSKDTHIRTYIKSASPRAIWNL